MIWNLISKLKISDRKCSVKVSEVMGGFWFVFRYLIALPIILLLIVLPLVIFKKRPEILLEQINKFVFWDY